MMSIYLLSACLTLFLLRRSLNKGISNSFIVENIWKTSVVLLLISRIIAYLPYFTMKRMDRRVVRES